MGPQFNVFSKLRKINDNLEEEIIKIKINDEISARYISGIDPQNKYKCAGRKLKFNTGDYHEYEEFNEHLIKIVGFKNKEDYLKSKGPLFFEELIRGKEENFTVGPIICRKLYNDFKENFQIATDYFKENNIDEKYFKYYFMWCRALEAAKENGILIKSWNI